MKQKEKSYFSKSNKYKQIHACMLAGIFILFFLQAGTGSAQEGTPTLETETATQGTPTPTELTQAVVTETATPVDEDAGASSEVTQILVQISSKAGIYRVQARLGNYGQVVYLEELEKLGIIVLEVPSNQLEEKMKEIQNVSGVGYVEPNYSVQAADVIPNDPSWSSQYGLISIHAPQGWSISTGSSAVTIAIIDSGVDLTHPDLTGRIVAGYDFVNSDNTPQDDYGHGTHVAGIAAANANNGIGVAGVSWGAKIMPIKVLNGFGGGSYANVAAGIVWAADHGAQVINLSLGGAFTSVTMENAVLYAYNKGILIVAASGNGGANQVFYPAHYPEVMAVGGTNFSNQPASFSNYGPEVDIAAPGENIYSLWPGGYFTQSGTSMAAPYVSGVAAILFSYTGNASLVRNAMQTTALDVGPVGWDLYSGAGLIQMDAALAYLLPPTPTPTNMFTPTSTATFIESGYGNTRTPNPPVNISPGFTPTLTFTLQSDLSTATVTQTFTPLTVSPARKGTQTPTSISTPAAHSQRWKAFASPYCCGGLVLILLGLWVWRSARSRPKRY